MGVGEDLAACTVGSHIPWLVTEPWHFSETLGFCEVRTTMVIVWGMLPPGDSRGKLLTAPHSSLGLPRRDTEKERTLEASAGSCSVWRSTHLADGALMLAWVSEIPREPGETSFTSSCRVRGP